MASPRRNPGTALTPEWFADIRVNAPAVERRAATLPARRSLKKEWQAAWLANAVRCIDLTTLAGDDTEARVARLCAKARHPVATDIVEALGVTADEQTVDAAVKSRVGGAA